MSSEDQTRYARIVLENGAGIEARPQSEVTGELPI
jgi:hypothetical protein